MERKEKSKVLRMVQLTMLLCCLLIATSCQRSVENVNRHSIHFSFTRPAWILDSLTTPDTTINYIAPIFSTIRFSEDSLVVGHTAMSLYRGIYRIGEQNSISVELFWPDTFGCSKPCLEEIFLRALESVENYEINENSLDLYKGDLYSLWFHSSLVEQDFLDVVWRLESLQTPDSTIVEKETVTSIELTETLRFAGLAFSCNEYFGGYEIYDTGYIIVDGIGWTEVGCPSRQEERGRILEAALKGVTTYVVGKDSLKLYNELGYLLNFVQDSTLRSSHPHRHFP